MNIKEIEKLFDMRKAINILEDRLFEKESYIRGTDYKRDRVQTSGNSDRTGNIACDIEELNSLINKMTVEYRAYEKMVEDYIDSLPIDDCCKEIVRLRHTSFLSWGEIAISIDKPKRSVIRKYRRIKNTIYSAST